MREERFEAPVDGGSLSGHRGGDGRPALLLHGGPAIRVCGRALGGRRDDPLHPARGGALHRRAAVHDRVAHGRRARRARLLRARAGLGDRPLVGRAPGAAPGGRTSRAAARDRLHRPPRRPRGRLRGVRRQPPPRDPGGAGRPHRGGRGAPARGHGYRVRPARAVRDRLARVLRAPGEGGAASGRAHRRPLLRGHERVDRRPLRARHPGAGAPPGDPAGALRPRRRRHARRPRRPR
jgi:hypothetical protein